MCNDDLNSGLRRCPEKMSEDQHKKRIPHPKTSKHRDASVGINVKMFTEGHAWQTCELPHCIENWKTEGGNNCRVKGLDGCYKY